MHLHLFSSDRDEAIHAVIEASRPYLKSKPDAIVAYMPLASLTNNMLDSTQKLFHGLAGIESIETETMALPEMEAVLRRAALVYIPGGNTFLLNHRLHISHLMPGLRKKVQAGLPLIGSSAGTVLCGPNILTSNDLNTVETPHFDGLNVTPFNFFVHYAEDEIRRAYHDEWLSEYHIFHDNPVIVMPDGAYVKVEGRKTVLVRGEAWILRKGSEKEMLDPGTTVVE